MLFTTSAFSHIFPEIRVDAVRFIDLLLSLVPKVVVSGWTESSPMESSAVEGRAETSSAGGSQHGRRVLNGYLALFDLKGKPGGNTDSVLISNVLLIMSHRKSTCWIIIEPDIIR